MTDTQALIARLEAATGATRSDIPGLWNLSGCSELTLGQLQQIDALRAGGEG